MKDYRVGIIGCTGMVGQRLCRLLAVHPHFHVTALAASPRSAGKKYEDAVGKKWAFEGVPIPETLRDMIVEDAAEVDKVASRVDFVFCAVDLPKEQIRALEEAYAKAECPVISNNSANRWTPDVPMLVPELNPQHAEVIPFQRKRLGTKRGFIAVKSNCSIQSYVPALLPLDPVFGLKKTLVCTYQAISGAGKTFASWPEMLDNVIPFIGGEEEKSEQEPLRVMGRIENGVIVPYDGCQFTAQCIRVPVSDGHLAAVFASFERRPDLDEIKRIWQNFQGEPQKRNLPSAPKQFLHYFEQDDRPQTRLDRELENGMAVSIGRLRNDTQYDIKFVCLSHNTLRGAAGGGGLAAELLCDMGYMD